MSRSNVPKLTAISILGKAIAAVFRRMWFAFALMFITAAGAALLELVPPLLLKRIIDSYLSVNILKGIWLVAAIYLAASLGISVLSFGQAFVATFIGQNTLLQLRLLMAEHLGKLPVSFYNRTPVGEIMSRLTSDVETVNTLFSSGAATTMGLTNALTDFVKIIGILTAMYILSPVLCLIVIASIPVVLVVSNYFRKNIYQTQLQVRRAVGAINTFLQESFSGIRVVKTYGKEGEYGDYFQNPLNNQLEAVNRAAVFDSYFPCVMQVIRAGVIATVILVGARTGVNDRIALTIGGLAAFADLIARLFGPIDQLTLEFQTLQQALAGLKRITELLQEKPEERGEVQRLPNVITGNGKPAIEIKNLSFAYQPGKSVLRDVTLTVPQGKRIAIVGRTGAGKTTLMNLTAGLFATASGTISVLGFDPYLVDPSERRRLLGVVPQNVYIFEGTVRENITLRDDSISLEAVEKAAKTVGLHDYIMTLEEGYDTYLGVNGAKLSFGQTQLLSLARAIVGNPALLLLDEPTSGVDALTEAAIFRAFREASKDRTIVTISHRLSGIIDADEVHIMAQGRIVESGTPDKLAEKGGWYAVFRQLEDLGWKME